MTNTPIEQMKLIKKIWDRQSWDEISFGLECYDAGYKKGQEDLFEHYFKDIKEPVIISKEQFDKLVYGNLKKQIGEKQ